MTKIVINEFASMLRECSESYGEDLELMPEWLADVLLLSCRGANDNHRISPNKLFHLLSHMPRITAKGILEHTNRMRTALGGDVAKDIRYPQEVLRVCDRAIERIAAAIDEGKSLQSKSLHSKSQYSMPLFNFKADAEEYTAYQKQKAIASPNCTR